MTHMRIAVLSDIHGNMPALQTVIDNIEQWQPDLVIVNGDIVNRGPHSLACLKLIQKKETQNGWRVLSGNHEEFIVECGNPDEPESKAQYELMRFAYWSYHQLNGEIPYLAALPSKFSTFAPDGSEFRVTHASMRNNRDGIYPEISDHKLREKIAPPPAVFVTGHTHRPLQRQLDETLVVNIGAVGSSFDEDRRASYGQFVWSKEAGWQAEIIRLPYDYEQIERNYLESGFLSEAGPMAQLMLIELRRAGGLVYRWATRYQEAMLAGEISMEESVRELLADEDLRSFLGAPGWTVEIA